MMVSKQVFSTKIAFLFLVQMLTCPVLFGQEISADTLIVIEAKPEAGFNYPYLLYLPRGLDFGQVHHLMVEPNNSGQGSDDFSAHMETAKMQATKGALGSHFSKMMRIPLLMPVFPRPEKEWQLYTQALDRDVMLLKEGDLARLDLQLIHMIEDARKKLKAKEINVREKVLMIGYSASGVFTNRFTVIHPEVVAGVASGGVNAVFLQPEATLDGENLIYPIGIHDFEEIMGKPFNREAYLKVKQFIYMGAEDTNDAILFDDGFSQEERDIIFKVLGRKMLPDRWQKSEALYRKYGVDAIMKIYPNIGHNIDGRILGEILEFYKTLTK